MDALQLFQYESLRRIRKLGMSVTHVLVVDDFVPWHDFVLRFFDSESDLQITSVAIDGLDAVQKTKELQPDLILMDLSLPGMNGIDATRQILIHSPRSKVLFVSEHRDSELIQAAFEVGACGYVLKSDSSSDLILGIRTVLLGQPFVSRSLTTWRENLNPTY
jgi:two-component system, NarL family, nitrate/nitrite response regulator NarL